MILGLWYRNKKRLTFASPSYPIDRSYSKDEAIPLIILSHSPLLCLVIQLNDKCTREGVSNGLSIMGNTSVHFDSHQSTLDVLLNFTGYISTSENVYLIRGESSEKDLIDVYVYIYNVPSATAHSRR